MNDLTLAEAQAQHDAFQSRLRELDLPTETFLLIDLYALAKAQVQLIRCQKEIA